MEICWQAKFSKRIFLPVRIAFVKIMGFDEEEKISSIDIKLDRFSNNKLEQEPKVN